MKWLPKDVGKSATRKLCFGCRNFEIYAEIDEKKHVNEKQGIVSQKFSIKINLFFKFYSPQTFQ